jgi:transposase-like protein
VDRAIDGKEAKVVNYILPSVGSGLKLDRRCPDCRRNQATVHSAMRCRAVSDLKIHAVPQRRMRCPFCGLTWTLRGGGVQPGRQRSDRLRSIGVMLYMLGLSYRQVQTFLPLLECRGSKSSIERDVAVSGQKARQLHREASGRVSVRVLGVDGTGAAMAGRSEGMLFFVDTDHQRLVCVEPLQEEDTAAVRRHVRRVLAEVGAQELRTDEHSVYEGIVPEGGHRLCLAHWRKSKGKRAYDLLQQATGEQRPLEVRTLERLLELLRRQPRPPSPPEELRWLVERYLPCRKGLLWKINQLLQHVERTWEKVSDDPVDPTNNTTERIIGLTLKIRSKTMRGFKSTAKNLAHPYLASYLRGQYGSCDLRKII